MTQLRGSYKLSSLSIVHHPDAVNVQHNVAAARTCCSLVIDFDIVAPKESTS